ncbi:MAG: hypothetical protein ABJB05_13070 [Parafilimonas sp.]
MLYTKEGSTYDTISCLKKSDSTTIFNETGANINIIPQTGMYTLYNNTLRIVITPDLNNPGFSTERIINLKR